MAVDMFLKIDGIPGESQDDKHKDEIEILSFSWGISNTSPSDAKGRLSARKTRVSDFSIVKYVDTASPKLFESCCQGSHVSYASFAARKAGKVQQEYYKIKLTDVLISSVQPAGSAGDGNTLESVSFSFGSAEISAAEQKPDGSVGGYTSTICGGSTEENPGDIIVDQKRR